jgi:DNA-directed RNA polymerase specialized sigma24 family protein
MKPAEIRPRERDEWLAALRARFVDVTRKRVPPEAVEDLVQEALTVVFEKGEGPDARSLPWCFQVLRNVIGNHYQKQRTRAAATTPGSAARAHLEELAGGAPRPTPLEALERAEAARLLRAAIDELAARDGHCGGLLRSMLAGAPAAPGGGAAASTAYVRAFRCRQKLKAILLARGVLA